MRVDKVLEENGFGSRKTVKRLFQRRVVRVDGKVITDGSYNVDSQLHELTVENKVVSVPRQHYYLFNKPAGVVTARTDKNRQTILDLLKEEDKKDDLYPVGRLDRDTEGLLLVTDNGQLGYQLLLPDKKVMKTYEAIVNEVVTEGDVEAFLAGIVFIGGERCKPAQLSVLSSSQNESCVRLSIQEGKFHQVKKMFLAQGKKVTYLKRIAMGPLVLECHLQPGEYRPLTLSELQSLKPYFRYKKEETDINE